MDEAFSYVSDEELKMQIAENFKMIDQYIKELKDFNIKYNYPEKAKV